MKLFAKLMIAALFIALALPFTILKDKNGNTLMSFDKLKMPDISMPDMPDAKKLTSGSGDKDFFYKWYDAQGNVQFTTEPPPDGVEYTIKGYDPNANVIQAVKAPPEEKPEEDSGAAKKPGLDLNAEDNPYSPENVKKLIEDAKDVQKILNQRYQDQNSALNQ